MASARSIDKIDEKLSRMTIEKPENVTQRTVDECSSSSSESGCCDEVNSSIPTDFNDIDHIFHIDFMRSMQTLLSQQKRYKNGSRRSCTFTNEQMRQIERENKILLKKILAQKPRSLSTRRTTQQGSVYQSRSSSASRVSSASINRRQQQQQIEFDNDVLKKKIERIERRNMNQ